MTKPPRLIRVFALRSVGGQVSSCGQRRSWSDWADAQADESSLGVHAILLVLSCSGLFIMAVQCRLKMMSLGITLESPSIIMQITAYFLGIRILSDFYDNYWWDLILMGLCSSLTTAQRDLQSTYCLLPLEQACQ